MLAVCAFLTAAQPGLAFAKLTPETARAFDRYVEAAESRMAQDLLPARFLHIDTEPGLKARVRGGEVGIQSGSTLNGAQETKVPGGLLQDWLGLMFIPGASITGVRAVLQDYSNYKNFYKPEVIESKEISHHDDEYEIFLRLYEKHILTVVLNANYHVLYGMLDAKRMYVTSHSTRIAEVKDPKHSYTEEEPVGDGTGFLWRLNSYWRFEEADGGVYAECEAISLSRDVPLGLGFMLKGFLERFPKESMMNTLRGTKAAVQARENRRPNPGSISRMLRKIVRLPDREYPVLPNQRGQREYGRPICNGLTYQHSIEWIAVQLGEFWQVHCCLFRQTALPSGDGPRFHDALAISKRSHSPIPRCETPRCPSRGITLLPAWIREPNERRSRPMASRRSFKAV